MLSRGLQTQHTQQLTLNCAEPRLQLTAKKQPSCPPQIRCCCFTIFSRYTLRSQSAKVKVWIRCLAKKLLLYNFMRGRATSRATRVALWMISLRNTALEHRRSSATAAAPLEIRGERPGFASDFLPQYYMLEADLGLTMTLLQSHLTILSWNPKLSYSEKRLFDAPQGPFQMALYFLVLTKE